jgi:CHAT domain-containing protein/TPR repeat protein
MDEQRLASYLELIQALVECPSGTVNDILNANRDLVDVNFVQVMEAEAEKMAAEGNSKAAWLQNLAAQLANFIARANSHTDYLKFLMEVVLAMIKSDGNPQVVYPILQQNFDKLDLQFAQILQAWTTSKFTEVASEKAASIAAVIGKFGYLINKFPMGRRAWNLEIGIACYSAASEVYTREDYPERWATVQNNLALTYSERIKGVRAKNIEEAIACYREASEVYTREDYPEQWALTQNNLGTAYGDREGVRAKNIEDAITCYREALKVRTPENYPEDWAATQNNLGNAYSDRIEGVTAKNIEDAIACFRLALDVYTCEDYPEQWALTQNNLGTAYGDREGVRAKNIEDAIACFREALKVRTPENYPEQWAATQNNLGIAYSDRIKGVRAANIEEAIACFRLALEIRTPTAFPLDCLQSGRNLGNTAFTAGFWDIALEGFEKAIQAVEKSRSWATSDDIRQQILAESIGVYEKAIQACVNNNQLEKAIEYCDRTRAQRLVDLMHSNDLYASGEIPPAVQKYLQEFEAKQREIDAEVEQLRKPSQGNKELAGMGSQSRSRADTSAYTEKIQELEREKQQIWENIRSLDPVLAGQVQVDPMQFAAMQQLIDNSQTAILCFYTTTDHTHIFVIYKDKAPQIHTCQGEALGKFQKWIRESWLFPYLQDWKIWQQGMGEFLSQLSQRLKVDELIGNCLNGIEELIVIPHLFLHQIPLAALPIEPPQSTLLSKGGPGGVLSDYFLIRYVPSCRILEYCSKDETIESPKYGIVENATDDLYFTPFECEQIAEIVTQPERLKGSQEATVAAYRNLIQKVNVIHSSHHAVSRLDNPLESRLFLGDGSITLGELMTPGWRLPQLSDVFMSCCETNLGGTEITDNLLSLGTGFLCAGARSVVSTLWAVDDFATSLFSIFYYQYRRREGLSRPEALRRAQVRLRTISGAELKELYQPQIDPLLQIIIGDLKSKLDVVQKEKHKLKLRQKSYHKETDEFNKLGAELKKITKRENQIQKQKKGYESLKENIYSLSNPFDDLSYWSGFICQGLH